MDSEIAQKFLSGGRESRLTSETVFKLEHNLFFSTVKIYKQTIKQCAVNESVSGYVTSKK